MFLLLLGTYYGFLATLPLGPSKLLCVRNFLITAKGTERFNLRSESAHAILIAGISGVIIAQIIILLSIYSPSLYALWLKPHVFNLFFLPILFYHWHKLRLLETDTYNDPVLGNSNIYKMRLKTAFFETLFIQLLNPIALPDGVFSRLMGVFLFRYSNIVTFISGILIGILGGYTLFFLSTGYLLQRLEQDTPTIYRLVKRVIHQFFFPLFFIIGLIALGRAPVPSLKNFNFNKEPWQDKAWPDILYNYDTWKRPLRFLKNNQTSSTEENIRAFNKMYFSQYFFEIYKKDGKQKLYHNTPESICLVSRDLNQLLDIPQISQESPQEIFDEWLKEKENRKKEIYNSISNRLLSLEKGLLLEDIVEKKLGSTIYNGNLLSKDNDPRLTINNRENQDNLYTKSPLFLTEGNLTERNSFLSTEKNNLLNIYTTNRIKLFLDKNGENIQNIPSLGWIEEDKFATDKNNLKGNLIQKTSLHNSIWSIDQIELLKNNNLQSWNNILSKIQKTIIGNNLQKSQHQIENNTSFIEDKNIVKFANMYKGIPLWNSKISRADLQTPEPNEFRSILANFVRHLLPGSIRARRRKALAWNAYQNRPHAPIFLHAIESLNLEHSLNLSEEKDFILMKNYENDNKQNIHILKTRWNFPIAHFVRGIALCSQAYIRRYIKLPVFIILKNISRQILFQSTEWQKDWTDLAQEVYVDCDYDGNDLYVGVKLPNILELAGKQVKIIRPFRLRYSQPFTYKVNDIKLLDSSEKNRLNYELDDYSYLTIWGDETNEPFGKVKKQPSFWQPIFQRINLIIRYKIYKKYVNIIGKFSWLKKYSQELITKISQINQNISSSVQDNSKEDNASISTSHEKKLIATDIIQNKTIHTNLNKKKKKKSINNAATHDQLILSSEKTILLDGKQRATEHTKINQNSELYKKNLLLKERRNLQNSKYSDTHIPNSFSVQKKQNREFHIKHSFIYLQRNFFTFKRSIVQLQKIISYYFHKTNIVIYRNLTTNINKAIRLTQEIILIVRKLILNLNASIGDSFTEYILIIRTFGKTSSSTSVDDLSQNIPNAYDNVSNVKLSQAHVLHKIWEENELINANITTLSTLWNNKQLLNKNLSKFLYTQGILENNIPENIQYTDWQEWIKHIPGYQPSLKIWSHIIPNNWTNSVSQYWKEKHSSNKTLNTDAADNKIDTTKNLNYLVYHTPLFEKAQKFHKIVKLSNFIQSYEYLGNCNVVPNIPNFYSQELTQTPNKGVHIHSIQNNLLKDLPIINKEMERLNSNLQLSTLKERISFPASYENKWKSKELKNRFRSLMKAAKQRNVLKESMLDKKHKIALPDQMRKDLSIFYQNFQPEDILFVSVLENWRYKILDDELLMFNIISSFLKFSQNERNESPIINGLSNSMLNKADVLPEEILLPQHIRELRILDNLEFEFNHNNTNRIQSSAKNFLNNNLAVSKIDKLPLNKNTTQDVSTKDTIMRFLWPKHRLEDLLYINRFLLGTSNQSRFSLLRLHSVI